MKKLLLGIIALCSCVFTQAQELILRTKTDDINLEQKVFPKSFPAGLPIGYCDTNNPIEPVNFGGGGFPFKMAIYITPEMATKYAGTSLTHFCVATAEDGNLTNTKISLTNNLNSRPFYTQDVTVNGRFTWFALKMDKPYTLKKNKGFFMVFEATPSKSQEVLYPIATDTQNYNENGDWIGLKQYDTYSFHHLSENRITQSTVCLKGIIQGENLTQYDIALLSCKLPDTAGSDAPFNLTYQIQNKASEPITSFEITTQFNDEAPLTQKVELAESLAPAAKRTLVLKNLKVTSLGEKKVIVTLSNPNGMQDEDSSNNTQNTVITILEDLFSRCTLLENFTTQNCGFCPGGHATIKSVMEGNERVIWVCHHAGFGEDSFTTDADRAYTWFYTDGMFAPAVMFDRADARKIIGGASGPVFSVSESSVRTMMNNRLDLGTPVQIKVACKYDAQTKEVTIKAFGKITARNLGTDLRMNIYLLESDLRGRQSNAGKDFRHNNVLRDVPTTTWGEKFSLNEDGTFEVYKTVTLNEKWIPEKMDIVAFISNLDSQNIYNCEVYNAAKIALINDGTGIKKGITEVVDVYTQGNTIIVEGEYNQAIIYSTNGMLLEEMTETTSCNLSQGIYIVKVLTKANEWKTYKTAICM